MKKKTFDPYYKLGFDHAIFKNVLHLKKPKKNIRRFYFGLLTVLIIAAFIFG